MLANNLLADPEGAGTAPSYRRWHHRSVFHPLEDPQLIEECFDQILATAAAIKDPFEQAFFVMVQLPYLQPFDDVNKRVSRLAANIPLIRANLSPLSFADVPRGLYTDAMLGVYELNRVELLRDVFIWAYERSAAAMPPSGSRWASPILSGCATAPHCALSSPKSCAAAWTGRRCRPCRGVGGGAFEAAERKRFGSRRERAAEPA